MRNFTKRFLSITSVVVVLLGVGVVFAAWTSTGTGSGTVAAGTPTALTVTVGTNTGLFPTGSRTVPFTVTNPNLYSVTLALAHPQSFTVDAGHSTCNVASVTGADAVLSDVVAAGATSPSRNVTISMSNAATDACQGATFTFALVVTGLSS